MGRAREPAAVRRESKEVVLPAVRPLLAAAPEPSIDGDERTDIFSKAKRSEVMSHIRGRDTGIELQVRHWLHSQGFGYRLCVRTLPGTPDIVVTKYRTVIFVNGCFWHGHGCHLSSSPKTNPEFWRNKIESNRLRDERSELALVDLGWRVVTIWECDLESRPDLVFRRLKARLRIARVKTAKLRPMDDTT